MRGRPAPWTGKRRFRKVSHGHDRLPAIDEDALAAPVCPLFRSHRAGRGSGPRSRRVVADAGLLPRHPSAELRDLRHQLPVGRQPGAAVQPAGGPERARDGAGGDVSVALLPRRSAPGLQRRARCLHPFLCPTERPHRPVGILPQQGDDQSRRLALRRRAAAGQAHCLHFRRQLGVRQRRARRAHFRRAASTRRCPTGTCACWRWAAIR